MKKLLSIILILAMCITLMSGCNKSNTNADKPTEQTKDNSADAESKDSDDTLTMFTNAMFKPFEYFEGEEIVGADIDIAKEIAKDMGKKLEVKHIEFDSIVPSVDAGKADIGAAGITITPERMKEVDFSIGYVKSIQHIICKKGANINSMEALKGKKIGVQLGTTGDLKVSDAVATGDLKDTGAVVQQYKSAIEAAQDIATGRLDAVVIDELPAQEITKQNSDFETVVFGDISETFGICVKKGNTELLDSINKTLERLLADGKIDEFINNHSK